MIVVTPGSGNGRACRVAVGLRGALRARGYEVVLEAFPDLEILRRWAKRGRGKFSLLICIGGDGTMGTAATAATRRGVPFLPVPSGFGNLFAGALRQPYRVDQVVELVQRGTVVGVDVGLRNGEPFLCHESFGLLQQIQDRAEARKDRPRAGLQRSLAYYQTALRHVRHSSLPRFKVTVDGRVVARDAVIATVSNVKTYGAWLALTPEASPIDGLFDVFVMRARSKREILARLVRRQLRFPAADDPARVYRGRRVSVAAARRKGDQLVLLARHLRVVVSPETAAALWRELKRPDAGAATPARKVA